MTKKQREDPDFAPLKTVSFERECADCGKDTVPHKRPGEVYQIRHSLWKKARLQPKAYVIDGRRYQASKLKRTVTLCIGCVELRLGRKLVRDDFAWTMGLMTKRLRNRIGETAKEDIKLSNKKKPRLPC
jgi:hypothetical protein